MGFGQQSSIVVGWAEDQGRREDMEDGFVFVDNFEGKRGSAFLAIYDGHGGRACVDYVTERLHERVLSQIRKACEKTPSDLIDMRMCLHTAFKETDRAMHQEGIHTSGCTACVCILRDEGPSRALYTAHVGDARAVLCRTGSAVRLTHPSDHKATDPEEMRRVVDAGGSIWNERVNGMLAITRAFGDHQLKAPMLSDNVVSNEPAMSRIVLEDQDLFLIVACDGLWDVLDDQSSCNVVLEGIHQLSVLCGNEPWQRRSYGEILSRMLVEEALARGTSDNITCMVALM